MSENYKILNYIREEFSSNWKNISLVFIYVKYLLKKGKMDYTSNESDFLVF